MAKTVPLLTESNFWYGCGRGAWKKFYLSHHGKTVVKGTHSRKAEAGGWVANKLRYYKIFGMRASHSPASSGLVPAVFRSVHYTAFINMIGIRKCHDRKKCGKQS